MCNDLSQQKDKMCDAVFNVGLKEYRDASYVLFYARISGIIYCNTLRGDAL